MDKDPKRRAKSTQLLEENRAPNFLTFNFFFFFGLFRAALSAYRRLGIKLELQLPACITVAAARDP